MVCFESEGKRPTVHPEAFVAPTGTLIGDVTVERGASVWDGAVLHADLCASVVREGANVQDSSVPGGMVAAGVPARPSKPIEATSAELWVEQNPPYYRELAQRHSAGLAAVEGS